jgi:hypothetical protein
MRFRIMFQHLLDAFVRDYPTDRNEHVERNGNPWREEHQPNSCYIDDKRELALEMTANLPRERVA